MDSDDRVFAVCQRGAEAALTAEAARARPELRVALQRPGLVVFAGPPGAAERSPAPVFARAWGAALGDAVGPDAVAARLDGVAALVGGDPWRLHVFERDAARPGETSRRRVVGALAAQAEVALRAHFGLRVGAPRVPIAGERVVDVVVGPDRGEERFEPWLVGWHRHGPDHAPSAGGQIALDVPAEAPSRAWRKLEEGLVVSGFTPQAGERAIELGAAPGGAAFALVRRGVHLVAVDPQAMDPAVDAEARARGVAYQHVQSPMAAVRLDELPRTVHWLLMDAHLAPQVALPAVVRWVDAWRDTLRGVIFTLKLASWQDADALPAWLARMRAMGLEGVRAVQLPSNRQEVCAYGTNGAAHTPWPASQ